MGFDPSFERPRCLVTLKSSDRTKQSVDDNISAPPWGLSTLGKEFSAAARIMQSSSKELSTLVAEGYKNVNKRTLLLLLLLLHCTLKIPLANVIRLVAEKSET